MTTSPTEPTVTVAELRHAAAVFEEALGFHVDRAAQILWDMEEQVATRWGFDGDAGALAPADARLGRTLVALAAELEAAE